MAAVAGFSENMDGLLYQAETLIERREGDALPVVNQLIIWAKADGQPRAMAQANYVQAYYDCLVSNNYDKAIELCEDTLSVTAESELYGIDYKMHMTLGNAYQLKGEIFSSQYWYMKGLRIIESRNPVDNKDKLFMATFYYNLSIIFTTRKLNDSGEDYLQKAIRLYEEAGSVFKLSLCYSAYADILEGRKEFDKAIELMHKALNLNLPGKDKYSIALLRANLGILYSRVDRFTESVNYLKDALKYFESETKEHEAGLVQFHLGKVLCAAGENDKGVELLTETEQIFKRLENKHELTNVYELLSSIMAGKGEYKMALDYHHKYAENVKHVFDSEKSNALTRAKQEFETEQKEKEAVLLREKNEAIRVYAESLEAANKDLEALSYSVSHDLKIPLSMIKNINSMTADDENGYHRFIEETCSKALLSIDSILSFSENINKNLLTSEYREEEIYPFIVAIVQGLQSAAHANGQNIEIVQKDKKLKCRINRDTLGRAIANIVGNSIKFSVGKGKINIEIHKENAQWLIITISDQGIGIPEELREHLFKKFSSAQREGLRGEKSTGLGLYITHSIIKLHGGTIKLDESRHKGTAFLIQLPLVQ